MGTYWRYSSIRLNVTQANQKKIKNAYAACFCWLANVVLASDGLLSTTDVLLKYNTGTAGMCCNLSCKSLSCVAIMYLRNELIKKRWI